MKAIYINIIVAILLLWIASHILYFGFTTNYSVNVFSQVSVKKIY